MNMHVDLDIMREILDRARRTETRVTKIALALNVNPGAAKPHWDNVLIAVPSRECAISDILLAVPIDWPFDQEIKVVIGGDFVCFLRGNCGSQVRPSER